MNLSLQMKYQRKGTVNTTGDISSEIYVVAVAGNEVKQQLSVERSNTQSTALISEQGYIKLSNSSCVNRVNNYLEQYFHLTGLFGIGIIVLASLLTLFFTCWPQHDAIAQPDYWFEPIITFNLTIAPFMAGFVVQEARILMNAKNILKFKSFLYNYLARLIGSAITFIAIYCYWVLHLNFPYPMPETLPLHNVLISFLFAPIGNWLMFPSHLKTKGSPFRKAILSLTVLNWTRVVIGTSYSLILSLPIVRHEIYQLTLAIIFPLLKKFNFWCNSKFTTWAFDCKQDISDIENIIFVGCQHSFSLTIVLGSSQINTLTACLLLLSDTLMNAWSFRSIIRLHQQGTETANVLRDKSLKSLALKEFLEILIPTVYSLTMIGSYLGPNYDIMGGIGLDRWQHKVRPLYERLETIMIFTTFESIRAIGFGLTLRKFFRLDMYSAYCHVIKNYGWYILITAAHTNQMVNDCFLLTTLRLFFTNFVLLKYHISVYNDNDNCKTNLENSHSVLSKWFTGLFSFNGADKTKQYLWIYKSLNQTENITSQSY